MAIELRELTINDYDEVINVWKRSDGVGLSDADSKEGIKRFLKRNPGLSYVAVDGGKIIGAALCGHDGRRGYIHHLAVEQERRRQGLGRSLVAKCHLFVYGENQNAIEFWNKVGWSERVELMMMSQQLAGK
jgi:putative acetyltransferase